MKRGCYSCEHQVLCVLQNNLHSEITDHIRMLNIDGDGAPGRYDAIWEAVGSACMMYRESDG